MRTRILVVDDEPAIADLLRQYLRRLMDNFEIIPAMSGKEAIELVKSMMDNGQPPDITLMDLKMPEMDGIECTEELTTIGLSNIHILSAYVDPELTSRAINAGVNGIMKKAEGFKVVAGRLASMVRALHNS
ncbi:MAG: response regulator [Candidatus Lokiarchaeota archaeon]|nr:response regulator [Candidatus Lokiarchaeota archaeon]